MNTFKVQKRDMETKAKKLRREGYVTGNLFGKEIEGSVLLKIERKEAERMQRKKSRILPAAVGHSLIHPHDAGLHITKNGIVLRTVEDLAPYAFHRGAHQLCFGVEIVVDRADRDPACRGDRTDTDRRPALFPDKLTAVF